MEFREPQIELSSKPAHSFLQHKVWVVEDYARLILFRIFHEEKKVQVQHIFVS